MKIEDISKEDALKVQGLLKELRPDWDVLIVEEDINLYLLGFINHIPCSMIINVDAKNIGDLQNELTDLEIDAYIDEEILDKNCHSLTEDEKLRKDVVMECMKKYNRYAFLQGFFL